MWDQRFKMKEDRDKEKEDKDQIRKIFICPVAFCIKTKRCVPLPVLLNEIAHNQKVSNSRVVSLKGKISTMVRTEMCSDQTEQLLTSAPFLQETQMEDSFTF